MVVLNFIIILVLILLSLGHYKQAFENVNTFNLVVYGKQLISLSLERTLSLNVHIFFILKTYLYMDVIIYS